MLLLLGQYFDFSFSWMVLVYAWLVFNLFQLIKVFDPEPT